MSCAGDAPPSRGVDDVSLSVLPVDGSSPVAPPSASAMPSSEPPGLRDPSKATARAPEVFTVRFETTAGIFHAECARKNGPHGVDRIFNLVKVGFFTDVAFFRVVREPRPFVIQFGISGDPSISIHWRDARLPVDETAGSNLRGTISFAQAGKPDTRTTQLFINLGNNTALDTMGFVPICEVSGEGMDVVDRVNGEYGEAITSQQSRIEREGNDFLRKEFPALDYITSAQIVAR